MNKIKKVYELIDEIDAEYFIWNEATLVKIQTILECNSLYEIKKISKLKIEALTDKKLNELIEILIYLIERMNKIEMNRWEFEKKSVTEKQKLYAKAILNLLSEEEIIKEITPIEYLVLIKVLKQIEISDEESKKRKVFHKYKSYNKLKDRDLQYIKQYEVQYIINILKDIFNRKQALLKNNKNVNI